MKTLEGNGLLHNSEDDIGLVSDTLKGNWRDHHDHEVEDPIGTARQLEADKHRIEED